MRSLLIKYKLVRGKYLNIIELGFSNVDRHPILNMLRPKEVVTHF